MQPNELCHTRLSGFPVHCQRDGGTLQTPLFALRPSLSQESIDAHQGNHKEKNKRRSVPIPYSSPAGRHEGGGGTAVVPPRRHLPSAGGSRILNRLFPPPRLLPHLCPRDLLLGLPLGAHLEEVILRLRPVPAPPALSGGPVLRPM